MASGLHLNAGLVLLYQHRKKQKKSSRRLHLLAEMKVRVKREILLNEDIELIYRTILNDLFSVFNWASTGSTLILGHDGYLTLAATRGFTKNIYSDGLATFRTTEPARTPGWPPPTNACTP